MKIPHLTGQECGANLLQRITGLSHEPRRVRFRRRALLIIMKIKIICVGKIKEKFYRDAVAEYVKRLSRYCKTEILECPDEKTPDGTSPRRQRNR